MVSAVGFQPKDSSSILGTPTNQKEVVMNEINTVLEKIIAGGLLGVVFFLIAWLGVDMFPDLMKINISKNGIIDFIKAIYNMETK